MLSKQIDILYHKLEFDYWKCVHNAKLIIKTQYWNVLFFRDLNGFHQGRGLFNMQGTRMMLLLLNNKIT